MVILSRGGDSDTTLVDLVNEHQHGHGHGHDDPQRLKRSIGGRDLLVLGNSNDTSNNSNIGLPEFDDDDLDDFECSASATTSTRLFVNAGDEGCCLMLPASAAPDDTSATPLDEYLSIHSPEYRSLVEQSRFSLCSTPSREFTSASLEKDERILYVDQREVAHATEHQTEWLVTHHATTCHMLAIRSTLVEPRDSDSDEDGDCSTCSTDGSSSASTAAPTPLTTLTHIDGTQYTDCVRDIIERHAQHHNQDDSSPLSSSSCYSEDAATATIRLDIHLVGGFVEHANDSSNATSSISQESQSISAWIISLLGNLSNEYASSNITMNFQTCFVSTANTQWNGGPMFRGIGINTTTGQLVPVHHVEQQLCGPQQCLRQARLWSTQASTTNQLALIFDSFGTFTIQPFQYEWNANLNWLLELQDDYHLLHYTSTSPQYECHVVSMIRNVLQYMKQHHRTEFCDAIQYERVQHTNDWIRVSATTKTSIRQ